MSRSTITRFKLQRLFFCLVVFKLRSDDFRNIESLNNVTSQYLRTGRSSSLRPSKSSSLVKVFVNWLGSKTYCRTNAAVGKSAFCRPDREAIGSENIEGGLIG